MFETIYSSPTNYTLRKLPSVREQVMCDEVYCLFLSIINAMVADPVSETLRSNYAGTLHHSWWQTTTSTARERTWYVCFLSGKVERML